MITFAASIIRPEGDRASERRATARYLEPLVIESGHLDDAALQRVSSADNDEGLIAAIVAHPSRMRSDADRAFELQPAVMARAITKSP